MLQEMKVQDALKKFNQGRTVLMMERVKRPEGVADDYLVTDLNEVFRDARFLVEVPAVANPDFEKAIKSPPSEEKTKKRYFLNAEDKERIQEMYKAGEEMDIIADRLNVGLTVVSRYINEAGLGDERHRGKPIPSNGSAAIPSAAVMGGTGRK